MNGVALAVCLTLVAFAVVALAVFAARAESELTGGTITHEGVRRWLKVIGEFGALMGMNAAFPFAASESGIWVAITCEVAGAVFGALLMVGLVASTLSGADRTGDLGESDEEGKPRHRRRVNPATGLPMVNRSTDAGGHPYGCGFDSSDDHRWDRD